MEDWAACFVLAPCEVGPEVVEAQPRRRSQNLKVVLSQKFGQRKLKHDHDLVDLCFSRPSAGNDGQKL